MSSSESSNFPSDTISTGSMSTAPSCFIASRAARRTLATLSLKSYDLCTTPIRAPRNPARSRKLVYSAAALRPGTLVAESSGSTPARAPSNVAASATVRPIGPAVSWLWEIGIIPARLTSPTVGLIPTIPFADDGQTIEPSVSDPTATAQRLAETAAPEPELDPQGLRSY